MIGGNKKLGKQSQAYVAIPMSWVRNNGLKAHDEVDVSEFCGSVVIMTVEKSFEKLVESVIREHKETLDKLA